MLRISITHARSRTILESSLVTFAAFFPVTLHVTAHAARRNSTRRSITHACTRDALTAARRRGAMWRERCTFSTCEHASPYLLLLYFTTRLPRDDEDVARTSVSRAFDKLTTSMEGRCNSKWTAQAVIRYSRTQGVMEHFVSRFIRWY